MKKKNISFLFLISFCFYQNTFTSEFITLLSKLSTEQKIIIGLATIHATAHLVYKARSCRTDENGNWVINGKTITPEERYNKVIKSSGTGLIGLPSYIFDITFGTESDWRDKKIHTEYPADEQTKSKTTTVITKKQCFATGSGFYCWYADNILRYVGDVVKNSGGILTVIVAIKELAAKITK